ncbi:type II toxin-antitoxin system HipA family toxin [Reyranella sp. CPCC 100927]|uniref:type II toxin-antitoxin system HipA family toxin n=1 Tax=Reyranella sp. CPCC 100927 TaxID=2599616 RepID=UPI00351AAC30
MRVYLNDRLVGRLTKAPSGATAFRYDAAWLDLRDAIPVSLSLPLREDAYRGESVNAVFENLLPDSDALRRRVAEKVGARGTDAYSLLAKIGRDCVGALQFIAGDDAITPNDGISGEIVDDEQIETLLKNLAQAPLGLHRDDGFRISVAGVQEKTALLWHEGRWLKPHGTTPTTHILKTQIGTLPNGIDLTDSVENEFYCLALAEAFGLPVNKARIATFGKTKALVIERFDRHWTKSGRLIRLPQEDCCQALSVPPTLKYQADDGPGMVAILNLLKGSDAPAKDQQTFLIAQMLFWMIGATDGHAKNFSVFLSPGGGYRMTPLYDVLTAQPSLDRRQIARKQMKLAMSAGTNRHYRIDEIHPRHFLQTAAAANIPESVVRAAIAHVVEHGERAFARVEAALPEDFPAELHARVSAAALPRLKALAEAEAKG